jgi:hypothetical protein
MARKSFVLLVLGTVIFILCSISSADVPHMINYQGKLTTPAGALVNDTVEMTFSIYPDTTGKPAGWTETQAQVVVKDGIFNVFLGSGNPIPDSVFDGGIKYLGVKVGSDPEMRPLLPMVSAPYAFMSSKGGDCWDCTASGITYLANINDNVGIGTTEPQAPLHVVNLTLADEETAVQVDFGNAVALTTVKGIVAEYTGSGANYGATAVYGRCYPATGYGLGGDFEGGSQGVRGVGRNIGVSGTAMPIDPGACYGVIGRADGGSTANDNYGVHGSAYGSGTVYGVYGTAGGPGTYWAGYFNGPVYAVGNVGIGTETPINKLDVEGSVAVGAGYSGANTAPTNGMIIEGNVGIGTETPINKLDVEGGVAVGAGYSGANTAPTNGMIIEGNVGIGNNDPQAKLEVGDGYLSYLKGTIIGHGSSIYPNGILPTDGVIGIMHVQPGEMAGCGVLGIIFGDAGVGVCGRATDGGLGVLSEGDAEVRGYFRVRETGRFEGTGNNYFAGNVGIGTTDPQRALHVVDVMRLEPRQDQTFAPSPRNGDLCVTDAVSSGTFHIYCYLNGLWRQLDP